MASITNGTAALLKEVVVKLTSEFKVQNLRLDKSQRNTDSRMSADVRIIPSHLSDIKSKFTESGIKPCESSIKSRLFAVIDHSTRRSLFKPINHEDIVCKINYNGEIISYICKKRRVDVSLIEERNADDSISHYHVIIEFPEDKFGYRSIEVDRLLFPSFDDEAKSIKEDTKRIKELSYAISKCAETFVWRYAKNKKCPVREYSKACLDPPLPEEPPNTHPTKKRRARASPESDSSSENLELIPSVKCELYDTLLEIFRGCPVKPNENARIFAVIHNVLVRGGNYNCALKLNVKDWPGKVENLGYSYLFFSGDEDAGKSAIIFEDFFSVAVMNNNKDFYVSIRVDNEKNCVKKMSRLIVPTFDVTDKDLDIEKIGHIDVWVQAIDEEFIKPALGRFVSKTSNLSSENTSEKASKKTSEASSTSTSPRR